VPAKENWRAQAQSLPERPLLRQVEMFPAGSGGDRVYVLRDPEGIGKMLAMPDAAALVALLMDGRRTLAEIQAAFAKQVPGCVEMRELVAIVRKLDDAYLLHGPRYEKRRRQTINAYLSGRVRPAAHAGASYSDNADELSEFLADLVANSESAGRARHGQTRPGPAHRNGRAPRRRLRGLISPHIDLNRGGPAFATAYKRLADECDADVFVIFGTAHDRMQQLFGVSRKDFATPLGVVATDQAFIDALASHLTSSVVGRQVSVFDDELAHRREHSIEFQTLFLQYLIGSQRPVRIVPILVSSFYDFMVEGMLPDESLEVQSMLAALKAAEAACPGRVCYISGADMAHVGRNFGDEALLDDRQLTELADDDRQLLQWACRGDANGFFRHVAAQDDAHRICGLSPTYMLLKVMGHASGKLLTYDQAVEPDRTACVSFGSVALY
jgi:AmmeMemoRadiSam system protein B